MHLRSSAPAPRDISLQSQKRKRLLVKLSSLSKPQAPEAALPQPDVSPPGGQKGGLVVRLGSFGRNPGGADGALNQQSEVKVGIPGQGGRRIPQTDGAGDDVSADDAGMAVVVDSCCCTLSRHLARLASVILCLS